jgi:cell division septum initiation protein DivIVA
MNSHTYIAQIISEKKALLLEKGYSQKEVDVYIDSIVEYISTVALVEHIEDLPQEKRSELEGFLQKENRTESDIQALFSLIELSAENTEKLIFELQNTLETEIGK